MDAHKIIFDLIANEFMKPINGFMYAVKIRDFSMMEALAKKYARLFQADKAFGCLLRAGLFEHRSMLTEQGLSLTDCISVNTVYDLMDEGEIAVLTDLIAGAPEILDKTSTYGLTPLCNSVDSEQEEDVKILLTCGAKPTAHASHGLLPIFYVKDVDIAKMLLFVDPWNQVHAKSPRGSSIIDHFNEEAYDLTKFHEVCKLFLQLGTAFSDRTRNAFIKSGFAFDECLNNHEEVQRTRKEIFFGGSLFDRLLPELKNHFAPQSTRTIETKNQLSCHGHQRLAPAKRIPSREYIVVED